MDLGKKVSVSISSYSSSMCSPRFGILHDQYEDQDDLSILETSTNLFNKGEKLVRIREATQTDWLASLSKITGPSGSVRGHKNVVRKSLENIGGLSLELGSRRRFDSMDAGNSFTGSKKPTMSQLDQYYQLKQLVSFEEDEQNQCVAYTTTLGVVRRTFEDSRRLRSILDLNMIKHEERDIYLNQEYRNQLRLRCKTFQVPSLYVDGQHIGGLKEVELMNESGRLGLILRRFKMLNVKKDLCICCGNARFIACQSCNGSRKSTIHHFKFNSVALRCIKCDRNDGLIQCPVCSETTSASKPQLSLPKRVLSLAPDMNNNSDKISSDA